VSYDSALAARVRLVLDDAPDVTEKPMFGGLTFLMSGRMFCGVVGDELMVRVGPDEYEESLARPNVRPMDFTGRPMKGYVFVTAEGCGSIRQLRPWVHKGLRFVRRDGSARARSPRR
jgi:TfoX/Sxy family transcriptional regulator of competence genes